MLVIAMTLGQPLTVFANTVKDVSQNDSLENNLKMTDVSVAEGFLSELADGNADRYEERQLIEDDQPSTATEENISTNGSGEHTETDSGIEADSSESSFEESSSEATLDSSTEDSHEESVASSAEDSSKEDSNEESDENVEGVWGTVPWTWDEETKTIVLEEGAAGTSATAPWKTYTNVVQISVNGKVIFPEDVSWLFGSPQAQAAERLTDLLTIEHAGNIDVSNVTNMDRMFHGVTTLNNIDVSNWNVSNVTDMNGMFGQTRSLASLDVSNWDVSNVQNMGGMFNSAESLTSLDVASWDVSSVTNMRSMFGLARSLSDLDLSNWDVSSVTDMGLMFNAVNSLTSLDLSRWDVSSVTNMSDMFGVATSLTTIDVSNWDVSNVTSMLRMFSSARALTSLDLSSWDVTNVTNTNNMFESTQSLRELTLGEKSIFASNVRLPRINAGLPYSGRWIEHINDEGDNGSTPVIYASSDEFMNQYDGSNPGTYIWERLISAPVTIRYEDTEGNELSEPDILNGEVGERYTSEPKEIPGWSVIETPVNASGRFTEEEQEVIYVYERSDSLVRGTWGTVPWTWDEETKTIVLEEGNAGTVATAPWKTYTSVTQIVVKAPVLLPVNSAVLFSDLSELMIIENGNNFNTSQVTTMASMFARLPKLKKVDVSNWDTSKFTNMFAMFRYAYGLEELDVSNWDTSNVTNMAEMFRELDNSASPVTPLTVLDVSKWKTGNVTDMRYMFGGKKNLTSLDVSNWNVSKVERMDGMFAGGFNRGNSSLSQLDVSNWNVSNVTNMNWMFENLPHLEVLDVSNWNTENVTSMLSMFRNASRLTSLDTSNWKTNKVTNMAYMFSGVRVPTEFSVSNWDTSSVTDMRNMFASTHSLTSLDVSNWNTENVTDIREMFQYTRALKNLDLSNWNTAKVTNMWWMFRESAIEKLDVSNFDTSIVESMAQMFLDAKQLNELVVGEHSIFSTSTRLPEILIENGYTGRWIQKEDAYGNEPSVPMVYESSFDFMDLYDGTIPGTYIWEKIEHKDAAPVTVKYEDTEGNQLSEPTILRGKVGLPYESEPKEIPGWYVPETPSNAHGIFSEDPQEVLYVYDRSDAAPVTVKYEDGEGNQLSEPTILSGKVGLPYESEPKEIPGWYVPETPTNAHGFFSEESQEVLYVYDHSDAAPVTVKYEDGEGNQLSEPTILSGKVGLPYESEPKEIPGWYVPETPSNAHGIFGKEAQEVVYVYDRSDAAPITVKYEDGEGNQLSEPTILSGKVGLPYESEPKEIPGWYVPETPSNAHGTFTEEAQKVIYIYDRSDAAPVTVKYEDTEGNQLSEPTILSGKVGLPYESEPKEIPGWYVPETPSNARGIFGKEAQEVVYVYDRSDAAPVTVKYEDIEGNQLSEPTILSGKVGLPYESEPKEVPGWYVPEMPSNARGIFSEDPQEVIYVYDRSNAAPVTVNYEDTEGNQLSEPTILSGKVGLPYESEPKEIPGWYVPETPSNAHGIFSEDPQEVLYVYDRSDAAPVTVKYEDAEGNQLSEPTILSGKVGLPYESEPKEIPGWYVPETPSNAHGIFNEEPQEVLYVYDRSDAAPVTVKYEDGEGNQLSEPTILSGKVGLPYESEPKEIPGWYVPEMPSNAHGIFGKEAQEVIYIYDRSDAAPVTVKYEDGEGNQLSEPTILSGKVGLPYESKPKEILGWYVPEMPSNVSGTFTEEAQEVIYIYDRSDAAPVIVKYEDTEGNQLSELTILSGKVGLPYESKPKEISGWTVKEIPDNASGTFTNDVQEVIYVYHKEENNGGQNTPEKENPENEKEDSNDPKLPNTGEAMVGQRIMIIVGSLLLLFAIFIIFDKKKKQDN
ncbi:MucBP domain-containing protein [Enterococcus casseliflavus]|uniref:MucBP domain-containing protein n=1 Tax=Enterococcus casseliflavus TaxID=37734 RepID=UPI0022E6B2BF|nr:MucBP domain-containing protein [Enterococcus casseliflavus]